MLDDNESCHDATDPESSLVAPIALRVQCAKGAMLTPYFILVHDDCLLTDPVLNANAIHTAFAHSLPFITNGGIAIAYLNALLTGRMQCGTLNQYKRDCIGIVRDLIQAGIDSIVA
jgi:hypothetical protein